MGVLLAADYGRASRRRAARSASRSTRAASAHSGPPGQRDPFRSVNARDLRRDGQISVRPCGGLQQFASRLLQRRSPVERNWSGHTRRCSARRCIISTVRQRRLSTSPINRPAESAQTTLLRRPAFPSAGLCGTQACGFSTAGCGRRRSKSPANFIFRACNLPMVTSAARRSRPVVSSPILLRTARECIAQAISSAGSRTEPSNILVEATTRSRFAASGSNSAKSKACCWSSPASRRPQS